MDYRTPGPQYASGGYIADAKSGFVINGKIEVDNRCLDDGGWSNGVWDAVFAGVVGAPTDEAFPNPPYTTLDATPVSREKPFLFVDGRGRYNVYDIDKNIAVKGANTVVLGLGHATLTAVGGAVPLTVAEVPGVILAGLTIDAGDESSPVLLRIGTKNDHHGRDGNDGPDNKVDALNPTTLNDVYFRVGGPHVGKADVSLEVNSDNVLIDHIWAWRADHGAAGSVGWDVNTGRNGG